MFMIYLIPTCQSKGSFVDSCLQTVPETSLMWVLQLPVLHMFKLQVFGGDCTFLAENFWRKDSKVRRFFNKLLMRQFKCVSAPIFGLSYPWLSEAELQFLQALPQVATFTVSLSLVRPNLVFNPLILMLEENILQCDTFLNCAYSPFSRAFKNSKLLARKTENVFFKLYSLL